MMVNILLSQHDISCYFSKLYRDIFIIKEINYHFVFYSINNIFYLECFLDFLKNKYSKALFIKKEYFDIKINKVFYLYF